MAARTVLALEPSGACGGVDTAMAALAWLVVLGEPDVCCFHHIVHNDTVVARFESLGVRFVDSPDDVPPGATLLLSAHGTAPATRATLARRAGTVIDAACPLVTKVHRELAARAAAGDRLVYLGRAGHDETDGALGVVSGVELVADVAEVDALPPDGVEPRPVALLAQTTLTVEELDLVEAAVRRRFDQVWVPPRGDICDATSSRQSAVREVAGRCDAVVVVGSPSSSNTASLVTTAQRAGAGRVVLVEGPADLPGDLCGTVAVTAGASTPRAVLAAVVAALGGAAEHVATGAPERAGFALPGSLRRLLRDRTLAGTMDDELVEMAARGAGAEELLSLAERRGGAVVTGRPTRRVVDRIGVPA